MDKSTLIPLIYLGASLAGQVLSWWKKWGDGEAIVLTNFRRTVAAVIGNFMTSAAVIGAGAVPDLPQAALLVGLLAGYGMDAAINKGIRRPWTQEERERKA